MRQLRNIAAMLCTLLAVPAFAQQQPVVLKFASGYAGNSAPYSDFIRPWLKKIEAESNGTLKFEIFADGALAKVGDTIDRVAAGIADMGWDSPQIYGQRLASFGVSSVPGLYSTSTGGSIASWRAYEKGIFGTEMQKEQIKVLLFSANMPASFMLRSAPKGVADFSGLKLAVGSKVRAVLIEKAGGIPVSSGPPQYYQSLEKGVIDGVLTFLVAITSYKVDELLNYYIVGPFSGGASIVFISQAKYDSLPADARKAIDSNSGEFGSEWWGRVTKEDEDRTWEKVIRSNKKNTVITLDAAGLAAWQDAFDASASEFIKNTPGGQAIYDGFKAEASKAEAEVQAKQK